MNAPTVNHRPVFDGHWKADDANAVYGHGAWGLGYFAINSEGNLAVLPTQDPAKQIDLHRVIAGLRERKIHTPVLLRFTDLVRHRLQEIHRAFHSAIADNDYEGGYACIYPIKVNQHRQVCEEIRDVGVELGFGLEAGSKPELLAVLGLSVGHNDMPIICNGFKDEEFIETVILATKLGRRVIPVVERFSDLELIVSLAEKHRVRPLIALRIKPAARGSGRWRSSAGVRSKFGLQAFEALRALELLKKHDMADCLKMVHFHVGSQLSDIRRLKGLVTELAYVYAELSRLGAGLEIIDVGGGLGVDYDGSNSGSESSVNYSIAEYAGDIVYRIKTACDDAGVKHPTIFSESGRAMVSHASILVFDVLGSSSVVTNPDINQIRADLDAAGDEAPQPIFDLLDAHERLNNRNFGDVFRDALQARDELIQLFTLGYVSLPQRADGERLFWTIGERTLAMARKRYDNDLPDDFEDLQAALSHTYYCNFSVFQSLPDSWAIDQLFPIMPIHRLNEPPTQLATLADITCDSDGKVDHFVHRTDIKRLLEVHQLNDGLPYYLGIFLVGAYQEILGDLHNLYGDTHIVHVALDNEAGWSLEEVFIGDSVREVLGYVQYNPEELTRMVRRDVERAVRAERLTVAEAQSLLSFYEAGIAGYTYLE